MKINSLRLFIKALKTAIAALENELRERIAKKTKEKEFDDVD